MTSWLHRQRLDAAQEAVRLSGARTILDLGCGEGDLLRRLAGDPRIERILGIDLDARALTRLRLHLSQRPVAPCARVDLLHGSMTEGSAALAGFDCAILIETIEHIDPAHLSELERAVFAVMTPRTVVVTTPNAEFNVLLGVPAHRFRHPDHRFEWDRARFSRWTRGVAARHGYRVRCRDIAGHHATLGGASQMAVFEMLRPPGAACPASFRNRADTGMIAARAPRRRERWTFREAQP